LKVLHRHLNHQALALAAIDDIIARGGRSDWEERRDAVRGVPELSDKIRQVCAPKLIDPYAQRYHFWNRYVQERRTSGDSSVDAGDKKTD
jgi:hypothetical protein